jgi:hypothetical protein
LEQEGPLDVLAEGAELGSNILRSKHTIAERVLIIAIVRQCWADVGFAPKAAVERTSVDVGKVPQGEADLAREQRGTVAAPPR